MICCTPNLVMFWLMGFWDVNWLLECLPQRIVNLITSVHVGFDGSGVDKCVWQFTPNRNFSVKTAYDSLFHAQHIFEWKWHFIWKLHVPPKIKTFLWL